MINLKRYFKLKKINNELDNLHPIQMCIIKLFDKFLSNKIKTDKQVPIMLTIKGNIQKGKQKDIFIDFENIAPISLNTIIKNMILLYDYNQLNFLKN